MKIFFILPALALVCAASFAAEPPLDVVERLRRDQQATPSNTWASPVNLLRGRIIFIRSGRRPWKLGLRNDRGFKYEYIISRQTEIFIGDKKLTQDQFIKKAKTGDYIEVKSTNNADMDPITVYIRYPEKTSLHTVTGWVKAVQRGRMPRILVEDVDGQEHNLAADKFTKITEGGKAVAGVDFMNRALEIKNLKVEYVLSEKGKFAKTLEILPGLAPLKTKAPPQAPPAAQGPPADLRTVTAIVKAFMPGHHPRLLLQDPHGNELNVLVPHESKITLEGETVGTKTLIERVRSIRYYEVTYGDLGGDLVTVSVAGTNTLKEPASGTAPPSTPTAG